MNSLDKLKKKLQNALKLSGISLRREFCSTIVEKFLDENIELTDSQIFDSAVKDLCSNLEKQNLVEQSIESEHVQRAIEGCLNAGYDSHETVFNVINAFDFPKVRYDPDRKLFSIDSNKSKLLADANSKAQLFIERYNTVLQRSKRNFLNVTDPNKKYELQTVDYLLTSSRVTLSKTLILGALLQVSDGKYFLEDPTGIVELDLAHAQYSAGFYCESSFVLASGYYEDKILRVSSLVLPPGEEYVKSRPSFGSLNYFGGPSNVPLKDSLRLAEHMKTKNDESIMIFSDLWLDHPSVFEKLELVFEGLKEYPPIAFIFLGNFMSEAHSTELLQTMKKLFRKLGELIYKFPTLLQNSQFVFVPGLEDPCTPHLVPRLSLPKFATEELTRLVPKAIFATNPCRLQYCTREIVLFRADLVAKLLNATLHKPTKEEIPNCVARTIISQGHLSPLSLNALTVHWDFDHCLRLFPLPDLVVLGDKAVRYEKMLQGCQVLNPGSFCDGGFTAYDPISNELNECLI